MQVSIIGKQEVNGVKKLTRRSFGETAIRPGLTTTMSIMFSSPMDYWQRGIALVSATLRTVLYLGIPSGALMFALAPQIVHVLYGYGVATRSPEELNGIADSLRIYAFGIFAWCLQPVLMRGFFSMHKTFKPVAIGTVMSVVFIGLCVVAVKTSTDYRMLPWAANGAATLLAIVLYFALEGEVGKLDRIGLLKTLGGSTVSALATGAFAFYAMHFWNPIGKASQFASLAAVGLVSMWIYYFITHSFGMPETKYFDRAMKRLNRSS